MFLKNILESFNLNENFVKINTYKLNEYINTNYVTQRENDLIQIKQQILQDTQRLAIADQELVVASARKIELSTELSKQNQSILLVKAIDK